MFQTKLIALFLIAACLLPATAAGKRKGTRTESTPYQIGSGEVGTGRLGVIVGEFQLPAGPEDQVSLRLEDSTGLPVVAEIVQNTGLAFLCGTTESPVRIEPNYPVTVRMYSGKCLDGQPAAATAGTIEATFSWTGRKIVDEAEYSTLAVDVVGWDDDGEVGLGTVTFVPPGRRSVDVEVADDSGANILFRVIQSDQIVAVACGHTEKPVKVDPSLPVVVRLVAGTCEDGSASSPTHGVIQATFRSKG
jgi:hypothetical protein